MKLNAFKLDSAGAGLGLDVGLGLTLREDLIIGAVIIVIGLANLVRMGSAVEGIVSYSSCLSVFRQPPEFRTRPLILRR